MSNACRNLASQSSVWVSSSRLRLPILRRACHSLAGRLPQKSMMTCPACDQLISVDTFKSHTCASSCPDCQKIVPTRKRFKHTCYRKRHGLRTTTRCSDCGKVLSATAQSQHKCYRKRHGLRVRCNLVTFLCSVIYISSSKCTACTRLNSLLSRILCLLIKFRNISAKQTVFRLEPRLLFRLGFVIRAVVTCGYQEMCVVGYQARTIK